MVPLLVVLVVILAGTIVVGGFLGGPVMARERRKTNTAKGKAKDLADELARAHRRQVADAEKIKELESDTERLGKELADKDAYAAGLERQRMHECEERVKEQHRRERAEKTATDLAKLRDQDRLEYERARKADRQLREAAEHHAEHLKVRVGDLEQRLRASRAAVEECGRKQAEAAELIRAAAEALGRKVG